MVWVVLQVRSRKQGGAVVRDPIAKGVIVRRDRGSRSGRNAAGAGTVDCPVVAVDRYTALCTVPPTIF